MKTKANNLLVLLLSLIAFSYGNRANAALIKTDIETLKTQKVLIVVTSFSDVAPGKKTGIWLEELATPYYILTAAGIEVTIVSPKGGEAPIDPKSVKPEFSTASVKRFLADTKALDQLKHTATLNTVNATDYDAIFYPGGHGPMWDLPENKASINLIETFYNTGKPVALVCHASAALKKVKAKNGDLLVKGKKVAGFTNSEEIAGGTTDVVPFSLEDMLKQAGAVYQKGDDWKPFITTDGVLITGQNPASAERVANKILELLKSGSK